MRASRLRGSTRRCAGRQGVASASCAAPRRPRPSVPGASEQSGLPQRCHRDASSEHQAVVDVGPARRLQGVRASVGLASQRGRAGSAQRATRIAFAATSLLRHAVPASLMQVGRRRERTLYQRLPALRMTDWLQGVGGYGAVGSERFWELKEEEGEADAPFHYHHLPMARPRRVGWSRNPDGTWAAAGEDGQLWEVFCAECGDSDGPAEGQPPEVQKLRGPYKNERLARRAARRHAERQ